MPRLRRVEPYVSPGYARSRHGTGFVYRLADGSPADDAERERIALLAIPPAWNEVWIATAANAHILAVGVDDAGRRQYLYHPGWREAQDRDKFERVRGLAAALSEARRSVTRELAADGLGRRRVLAAAFRTLDLGAIRIGSEEYLHEGRSRGLTTLLVRNASLEGRGRDRAVRLRYRAKGGKTQDVRLADAGLVDWFADAGSRGPAARLYAWRDGRRMRALAPADVNRDVRERTGGDFTAKDFRTLRGTIAAARSLAREAPSGGADDAERAEAERRAVAAAAGILGNTPAIARESYIDPLVLARYAEGRVISLRGSGERALLELLE